MHKYRHIKFPLVCVALDIPFDTGISDSILLPGQIYDLHLFFLF